MVFSVHYLIGGYSHGILKEQIRLLENSIHFYDLPGMTAWDGTETQYNANCHQPVKEATMESE